MNTGISSYRNSLRRLLLPALALVLSLVLLGAGISGLSGGTKTAVAAPLAEPAALFDLQINKSHLPTVFTVGSGNIYFINVSRTNTETINQAVLVEDNLQSGLTWTPVAAIGNWNCGTSTATKVSCFYTVANPANFDQISFTVNVPASIPTSTTSVSNVAQLIVTDAITTNNVFTDVTPIDTNVSLEISKTADPTIAYVGQAVVFEIVVKNSGSTTVNSIQVTDVLDAGLTYESCTGGGCSYNSTTALLPD